MSIPFHDNIDFLFLEALNFRWQVLSSDPASPVQGQHYFNSATLHPVIHDGAAFRVLTFATALTPAALTVGGAAAVGTSLDAARADHAHAAPGLATAVAAGFMPNTDKAKLDAATASPTANTLAQRDAAGRMQTADPVSAFDVVNLQTLQATVAQQDPKGSVKCRTTANINLAAPGATHDGVTLANGDRFLAAAQTTASENGIYQFNGAAVPATRTTDADAWAELIGAYVIVEQGTVYADTAWLCTVDAGGTLGTTAVTWVQFGNATSYSAATDPTATGTSVYSTTVGTQFRFRAIKANSTKVAITLVGADILVDVTEANLNLANLGGTLPISKGGTGATTAPAARTALGAVGRYDTTIGNGSATSFTIAHNLNTDRPSGVEVWEAAGQRRRVYPRIQVSDANNIVVTFATGAPAANSYVVVVSG